MSCLLVDLIFFPQLPSSETEGLVSELSVPPCRRPTCLPLLILPTTSSFPLDGCMVAPAPTISCSSCSSCSCRYCERFLRLLIVPIQHPLDHCVSSALLSDAERGPVKKPHPESIPPSYPLIPPLRLADRGPIAASASAGQAIHLAATHTASNTNYLVLPFCTCPSSSPSLHRHGHPVPYSSSCLVSCLILLPRSI